MLSVPTCYLLYLLYLLPAGITGRAKVIVATDLRPAIAYLDPGRCLRGVVRLAV